MTTTYASGETPQIGDTVRFTRSPLGENPVGKGGLDTVVGIDGAGWVICALDAHKHAGWKPEATFTLVSRAAAHTKFEPGQKVVALADFEDDLGRRRLTKGKTYTNINAPASGDVIVKCDVGFTCFWGNAHEHFAPAPAPAPATIDVSAIKPGDFVTVRLKVIEAADKDGDLVLKGQRFNERYTNILDVVGHEPKAPEPLKVGDRVRVKGGETVREILAIVDGIAWTKNNEGRSGHSSLPLANLERVS